MQMLNCPTWYLITRDLQTTRQRPFKIYICFLAEYPYVPLALVHYTCYQSKRGLNGWLPSLSMFCQSMCMTRWKHVGIVDIFPYDPCMGQWE
jgi:hypothetical protein